MILNWMQVYGMEKLKNRKRIAIVGIIIAIICCLIPFYMIFIKTESIIVTWMPMTDVNEQINEYIKAGYCKSGYVPEDNTYAEIKLTKWQRKKWLEFEKEDLHYMLEEVNKLERLNISISNSMDKMTVFAYKDVSLETLATYLTILSYSLETIQVLNAEENWGFEFILIDSETNKVIYSVFFPKEEINIKESFWDEIE